eukprot:GHVT01090510.1.p1 GENE.GHVT01090510.1~~GHVT01090510.1.p1  ORF type:complete len:177 (-),score=1.92 GHVT01090510.1:76-606(-)
MQTLRAQPPDAPNLSGIWNINPTIGRGTGIHDSIPARILLFLVKFRCMYYAFDLSGMFVFQHCGLQTCSEPLTSAGLTTVDNTKCVQPGNNWKLCTGNQGICTSSSPLLASQNVLICQQPVRISEFMPIVPKNLVDVGETCTGHGPRNHSIRNTTGIRRMSTLDSSATCLSSIRKV